MVFSTRGRMMEVCSHNLRGGGGGWGKARRRKPVLTALTWCNIREQTLQLLPVGSAGEEEMMLR